MATIEEIRDLDVHGARHFRLRFNENTAFSFRPGQHVIVYIPSQGKEPLKRYYSIASPPSLEGRIELCWKGGDGGKATELMTRMKEGDELSIQGPMGLFGLREPLAKRLVFVSVGTGIAPFRSMMLHVLEKNPAHEIWNFFGNRFEDSILYREEFENLEKTHAHFKNIFTVSRSGDSWPGEKEYNHKLLGKYLPDTKDTDIYVCGMREMIAEVEKAALDMGIPQSRVLYEKYG